jgi:hypothetical protein
MFQTELMSFGEQTVIFRLLLESILPAVDHYLKIYTFFKFAIPLSTSR